MRKQIGFGQRIWTKWILANWPWKLLSLAAAAVLWVAVASEPEMATVLRVPVQFKNTPSTLEISSDIQSTVRLELRGASGRLRQWSAAPTPVVLDFSKVTTPGERTFNIDASEIHLPRGVQLMTSVPAELRFVFENREQRAVPVQIEYAGTPPNNARVVKVDVDPPNLAITGPTSRVNLVQSVTTDPIDLSNARNGQVFTTAPFIKEPFVRFVHFENVRVKVILGS
jgi:YbbR domain-containing protein